MTKPLISVLLPVHNAASTIDAALTSMARQTEPRFEMIVVDDGSTDGTHGRLMNWADRDSRIRLLRQEQGGTSSALNAAIKMADGDYLARMDGDDIALPGRLAWQRRFLDANPAVDVCGTWIEVFGDVSRRTLRYPTVDGAIRARLYFDSPLAHPSVMLRRSVIEGLDPVYRVSFSRAQDYDLWERLQSRCVFANLPRCLLRYRMHGGQSTVHDRSSMLTAAAIVRARLLRSWWPELGDEDMSLHQALCTGGLPITRESLDSAELWLLRLAGRNDPPPLVSAGEWRTELAVKWWETCFHFSTLGGHMIRRFVRSPLLQPRAIRLEEWLRLLAKGALPHVARGKSA